MTSINKLESILVATDLTETTAEVFRTARALAVASGAVIRVIHVVEDDAVVTDALARQRAEQVERSEFVNAVEQAFGDEPRLAEAHAYRGEPAEVIISEAQRVGADVIILGTHRNRGFGDRVLGSTAESVVRRAAAPVLILNGPLQVPITRIAVPTDFSDPSRRACEVAVDWATAAEPKASVTLVHIAGVEFGLARDEELKTDLKTEAGDATKRTGARAPIETRLLRGSDSAGALITYMEETGTSLVAIGTSADSALKRAFLGSFSAAMVRRAAFPVLLVSDRS